MCELMKNNIQKYLMRLMNDDEFSDEAWVWIKTIASEDSLDSLGIATCHEAYDKVFQFLFYKLKKIQEFETCLSTYCGPDSE